MKVELACVISDQICIIGKLEYLWNKKRYHRKKKHHFTPL